MSLPPHPPNSIRRQVRVSSLPSTHPCPTVQTSIRRMSHAVQDTEVVKVGQGSGCARSNAAQIYNQRPGCRPLVSVFITEVLHQNERWGLKLQLRNFELELRPKVCGMCPFGPKKEKIVYRYFVQGQYEKRSLWRQVVIQQLQAFKIHP